jgi:hypothetical protein
MRSSPRSFRKRFFETPFQPRCGVFPLREDDETTLVPTGRAPRTCFSLSNRSASERGRLVCSRGFRAMSSIFSTRPMAPVETMQARHDAGGGGLGYAVFLLLNKLEQALLVGVLAEILVTGCLRHQRGRIIHDLETGDQFHITRRNRPCLSCRRTGSCGRAYTATSFS